MFNSYNMEKIVCNGSKLLNNKKYRKLFITLNITQQRKVKKQKYLYK